MIHNMSQISDEERAKQEYLVIEYGKQEYRDLFNGWVQQKIMFFMLLKKGEKVKYIKDGEILKIISESIQDLMKRKTIQGNLDQQRYLRWEAVCDSSKTQHKVYWRGELLKAGGFGDQMQQKEGKWIDLWENFWIKSKVYFIGNYTEGRKTGKWDIFLKEQRVGGGTYNQKGMKHGEWTEIDNNFKKKCQVTYSGEYQDGRKCGNWRITYNGNYLGGGNYNQFGLKNGKWLDLHEDFWEYEMLFQFRHCQVGYYGEYQNGRKINKWNIIYRGYKEIEQNIMYDQSLRLEAMEHTMRMAVKKENGQNCIQTFQITAKLFTLGNIVVELNKENGKQSSLIKRIFNQNPVLCMFYFHFYRGGGLYNCGLKVGKWVDLHEKYFVSNCGGCNVFYKGEYQKDLRQGRWDIVMNNQNVGGGNYNENGLKHGRWIDFHENYSDFAQIIHYGEYKNGIKQGIWAINFEGQTIGGGEYDQSGLKNGDWVDLHINFTKQLNDLTIRFCQVTYKGEYFDGIKSSMWETCFNNGVIGGGIYNEEGNKDGQWVDLHHNFRDLYQVVIIQNYQNGKKLGTSKEIELQ
ncbi:unnamed protein product (macronuclear) [Paramecium tetraurelia]|uniref:Uncharacterized protein n=1 Tax=Paramecium tetraurelia TaxID=5888 RepID=A0BJK9_PARTE|nr:uncharacterized protein GSPATT00029354001 [Paramecium tetraurelia]CAK58726.1 unnamed protein product [Paramecium tetraurelia]|eukprot:XP_001426124.1 hypothetical protein (macronuclear) [Paramecium tetraurelia strain d4-2]